MCFPPVDTVVNGEISSKNGRMLRIIVLHEANLCIAHVGVFMYVQLHTDIISTPWFWPPNLSLFTATVPSICFQLNC